MVTLPAFGSVRLLVPWIWTPSTVSLISTRRRVKFEPRTPSTVLEGARGIKVQFSTVAEGWPVGWGAGSISRSAESDGFRRAPRKTLLAEYDAGRPDHDQMVELISVVHGVWGRHVELRAADVVPCKWTTKRRQRRDGPFSPHRVGADRLGRCGEAVCVLLDGVRGPPGCRSRSGGRSCSPAVEYAWVTDRPVAVCPSPKSQA